jgi:hypothetical protein
VLDPCGGVNDTDAVDVKRGDDETFWLVNGITGSPVWKEGARIPTPLPTRPGTPIQLSALSNPLSSFVPTARVC